MKVNNYPRIVIAGLSGDSGKTLLSLGIIACLKDRGMKISAFKKGPDYIDAAWLSLASGTPARNLDTYLMGFPKVKKSFLKNSSLTDFSIIEGNRGVFDGLDSKGTHSTAELAKLIKAPVIIVLNISKVTRTAAASILGCSKLDPDLYIAGVILNQVAGERHLQVAKSSIEEITGIPVIGAIPKLQSEFVLPSRHLGLITPDEFENKQMIIDDLKKIVEENVDLRKLLQIARLSPSLEFEEYNTYRKSPREVPVRIGYFRDQAFSFYYPENLEMLVEKGADLIPVSALYDTSLDDLDALYIGGGFPETNLAELQLNHALMSSLKILVEDGLPVYAECGGLMYLARDIEWERRKYQLAGILPVSIKMHSKPQGHGYYRAIVDEGNPFFNAGTQINGHEFHYSEVIFNPEVKTTLSVIRGNGSFNKQDGLTYKNVFASYLHVHALAAPEWADGIIKCAISYRKSKNITILNRRINQNGKAKRIE